jgi:predicted alpha/beta hydrolase family esterase
MAQQLLYIHGGQAFSDYENFLTYLRTCEIRDPLGEKPLRWSDTLAADLGDAWEVYAPSMPNKQNAKYEEWKIWFERYCEFLSDGAYLIGWSQGGYFLVKYLLENPPPVAIARLYLLAAPFAPDDFGGEDGGDFAFETSRVGELAENAEQIILMHSEDDFVVPFAHFERYRAALPSAAAHVFSDRNHFLQPAFPELLDHLRAPQGT